MANVKSVWAALQRRKHSDTAAGVFAQECEHIQEDRASAASPQEKERNDRQKCWLCKYAVGFQQCPAVITTFKGWDSMLTRYTEWQRAVELVLKWIVTKSHFHSGSRGWKWIFFSIFLKIWRHLKATLAYWHTLLRSPVVIECGSGSRIKVAGLWRIKVCAVIRPCISQAKWIKLRTLANTVSLLQCGSPLA